GSQAPGDTTTGNWFLWSWQDFVNAGGLAYLDVISFHHFYSGYDWDTASGLDSLLAQVDANRGGKPVWITEMGWAGDPAGAYLEKARSFVRSMAVAWARPFVGRYFWYSFHESETYETSNNRGFIQTLNGSAARGSEPDPLFHPVYQAAAVMTGVLGGFEAGDHPAEVSVGPAARAFHLSKNGEEVWLAWQRAGGGSSVINLDTGGRTTRVIGMFGEDLGLFAGGALTLADSPVYLTTRLDWNPNVGRIAGSLRDGNRPNEWGNAVAGATVALTGPVNATTVTDADGNYLFENLPDGAYTVQVIGYPATPPTWAVTVSRQAAWGRTSFSVALPVAISPR
ncbi:MAG: carboxypeptidase regulatory-like domain-containing protein, partial [Anaerolineales bacterium]